MFTDFTTTSAGALSCAGAKLRIALTPARTRRSTPPSAASPGATTVGMSGASGACVQLSHCAHVRARAARPTQPPPLTRTGILIQRPADAAGAHQHDAV